MTQPLKKRQNLQKLRIMQNFQVDIFKLLVAT